MISPTPIDARFTEVFRRSAEIVTRAPGRINLIGEHVDYQGGLVMPAAIDRYIVAAAAENGTSCVRIWSALTPDSTPLSFELESLAPLAGEHSWCNYIIGVVAKYREANIRTSGFDIAIDADLPTGAGLSSSAALESATALVVETLAGAEKSPLERALLCQSAEHDFAGVPCGIMDQLAVNAGLDDHALMIDCQSLDITPTKLPDGIAMVVIDSKVKHALADGEYAKRRADCERAADILNVATLRDSDLPSVEAAQEKLGERLLRRAKHVVSEIDRVRGFAAALQDRNCERIGRLLAESHGSLRDDYEVSCRELDELVEAANSLGAIGSRMMGGGFGGSTINLVHADRAKEFVEKVPHAFEVRAVRGADQTKD